MTSRYEVNIDHANKIRVAILHKLVGHAAFFQEESQIITIDTHAAIDVGDDEVQIDPVLLFQRLIISGYQANDLVNALTQELCNCSQFCWTERTDSTTCWWYMVCSTTITEYRVRLSNTYLMGCSSPLHSLAT